MNRRQVLLGGLVLGVTAACSTPDPTTSSATSPAGTQHTSSTTTAPTSTTATTSMASPTATPTTAATASPTTSSTTGAKETAGPATGSVTVTRTLATGINVPWGLARLPDGSVLVSARDSFQISRIVVGTGATTLAGTVPGVVSNYAQLGEAGLLGIAVAPTFAADHLLYASFSTASDNRIAVMTYDASKPAGRQLGPPKVLVSGIPHGVHHNGGRLGFGPDGYLYATTGESGIPALAQDKSSLGGKILRLTTTGEPAPGNPFGTLVWTYGHRNVQGLAWDTAGRLWASEFGDKSADELNLITRGSNYGWPATQGRTTIAGYTSPVAQWGTDEDSPSGIAYAGGSVWMAALQGQRLWRIPLRGTGVVAAPQSFLDGTYGRLRSILALDAHTLLVTTSNRDGRVAARSGDDRILVLRVT